MNEKLVALYTQALEYAYSKVPEKARYNDIFYSIVAGKFAELVVKECAAICDKDYNRQGQDGAGWRLARTIEEHFGVEE